MTSLGIIANSDKATIMEVLTLLRRIPDFKIIFVKQSENEKLYIVTDRVFNLKNGRIHE